MGVYVKLISRLLVLLGLYALLGCTPAAPQFEALVYETPRPMKPFKLVNQHNQTVDNKAFENKWTLLFLGYTNCPDICPMTLSKLAEVKQQLPQHPALTVWFVSVDPARDVSEKLKLYVEYFDPNFTAVTAPHTQLFPFVRNLGLVYAISEAQTDNYAVDHSASVALVDPQGAVRAIFKPEFKAGSIPLINSEKLKHELDQIISYYQ